jgi:hypothetical protein
VVAVGTIGDGPGAWFSTEGISWTAQPDAFPIPDVGSGSVVVTDVVADGTGWLAVGRWDPFCQIGCGTDPIRAFVWTSTNGTHWSRVATQSAFKGVGLNAVTRGADGFVAAGDAAGHAAILRSADGLAWSRVPDDPMFRGRTSSDGRSLTATSAAFQDGDFAVLGMEQGEPSRVDAWWSADGRTWAKSVVEHAVDGQVFSATATPTGLLATGPSGGAGCVGGIWSSTDGRRWLCDATSLAFTGFGPYAAAANDAIVVAVGLTSAGVDEESPDGLPGDAWFRTVR